MPRWGYDRLLSRLVRRYPVHANLSGASPDGQQQLDVACGSEGYCLRVNPEAVPVARFAMKLFVAFATILVDPFEGDGLQFDRLITPDGAPTSLPCKTHISECGLV